MNHKRHRPRQKLVTRLNTGGAGKSGMGIGLLAVALPPRPCEARARLDEREQREEP